MTAYHIEVIRYSILFYMTPYNMRCEISKIKNRQVHWCFFLQLAFKFFLKRERECNKASMQTNKILRQGYNLKISKQGQFEETKVKNIESHKVNRT